MKGDTGLSLAKANVAVVLFGLSGLFGKLIELSPLLIVLGRVLFASLTLALVALATRTSLAPGSRRTLATLAASGILLAFHWTTFFQSIQVSTVAIGLVSFATFPLFVVLFEGLFLGERLRAENLLIALLTLAGAAIVAFGPGLGRGLGVGGPGTQAAVGVAAGGQAAAGVAHAGVAGAGLAMEGVLWGLASAASFALLAILNKRSAGKLPSVAVAFYQDLAAALVLIPLALLGLGSASSPGGATAGATGATGAGFAPGSAFAWPGLQQLVLLAVLGILCTALAHTLFIASLRGIRARTAAVLGSLEPLYGAIFALLLLGEIPSPWTAAGGILIVGAAVYESTRSRGLRAEG
ncbi:MAG: DMT family transporter [Spirochaetota bacterium]